MSKHDEKTMYFFFLVYVRDPIGRNKDFLFSSDDQVCMSLDNI